MKFKSTIPPTFKLERKNDRSAFVLRDNDCPLIRLISPVKDPFGQEWLILLRFDKQKNDRSEMATGVTLKLILASGAIGEIESLQIRREIYKSTFAFTNIPCKLFISFKLQENLQLAYTIFKPD